MKDFRIVAILFAIILCLIGLVTVIGISKGKYKQDCNLPEYDYIINLDDDDIDILTEEGKRYIVHPDSLEEFIEKDNL